MTITRPNHVWVVDITYLPMQRGFVYLCANLDWASRRVLAWRLSYTLTTNSCLEGVREAITQYVCPEIFNTDQGCQSTSQEFTGFPNDHGIQIGSVWMGSSGGGTISSWNGCDGSSNMRIISMPARPSPMPSMEWGII
jgi:putative transposase